jgi:hypothetical protein
MSESESSQKPVVFALLTRNEEKWPESTTCVPRKSALGEAAGEDPQKIQPKSSPRCSAGGDQNALIYSDRPLAPVIIAKIFRYD